ncbi:MAG: hypothetical protein BroJett018_05840 [Chloroflexota bacterium]|nr:NUDIX domain-containing protein [Chloroflexota bacterium]NOG63499.1 NUDIX domain-containing protein [Chloroflexota bacterium]GIK62790.1 MAG: hypothetical protein BroJett018_05840 [Chloroflexota bacterium]
MSQQSFADGYIKWLRSHVGHQLIYLVYTNAFVFDEENRLLVQERYDFDWVSVPGGALEPHESLLDCVRRETFEETGIECSIERLIGVYSHPRYNLLYPNGDQVQQWGAAFVCRAASSDIKVDGRETLKASFRPVEEIRHRLPIHYQEMLQFIETHPDQAHVEEVYFGPNGRPFYSTMRQYVGQAQLILPGVSAAVFNEKGELLVAHQKKRNFWDIPGGLADLDESSSATAVRETREETGLEVRPIRLLSVLSDPTLLSGTLSNGDEFRGVDLVLECRVVGGEMRPDGVEVDQVAFKPIDELIAQPNLRPFNRQRLLDILNRDNGPFIS